MKMERVQRQPKTYYISALKETERFSKACLRLRVPYCIRFVLDDSYELESVVFNCLLLPGDKRELDELYHKINGEMAS